MAVKRIQEPSRHNRPDLVDVLAEELATPTKQASLEVPLIIEETRRFGNNLHVTVVWDRWDSVRDKAERGAVILDAYSQAGKKDDLGRITLALGLTKAEAETLGLEF